MSRTVAIVTDTSSDLSPDASARHGITVVPHVVDFGGESFRDQVDLDTGTFMRKLAESTTVPHVRAPASDEFETTFRSLAAGHDEICCVLVSGKLSDMVRAARTAATAVAGEIAVEVVDTAQVSCALGVLAVRAAELAAAGVDAAGIAATLVAEQDSWQTVLFAESMDYLHRGGEIGKAAQLVGAAISLRPLIRLEGGLLVPFERTRTRPRAMTALLEFVRDLNGIEHAAVLHNTTPDDALALARELQSMTSHAVDVVQIGPVISSHVGPGVLGVALKEGPRV